MSDALREFALACRRERDRLQLLRLDEDDRRFEAAPVERAVADGVAARLIASVRQ